MRGQPIAKNYKSVSRGDTVPEATSVPHTGLLAVGTEPMHFVVTPAAFIDVSVPVEHFSLAGFLSFGVFFAEICSF